MKKNTYNVPEIELVVIDTKDIMSASLGLDRDPFSTDIF